MIGKPEVEVVGIITCGDCVQIGINDDDVTVLGEFTIIIGATDGDVLVSFFGIEAVSAELKFTIVNIIRITLIIIS